MSATIVGFRAENVQRLQLVELRPSPTGLVIVAGDNANGKSSVLNSVAALLGGKKLCPAEPIRQGEDRAEIEAQIGDDLLVTRTFKRTADGYDSSVMVRSASGARGGQALLDSLVSAISFDPMAFARDRKGRAGILRGLVGGLDFAKLDMQIAKLEDERRGVGREVKLLAGQAAEAKAQVGEKPEELDPFDSPVPAAAEALAEADKANEAWAAGNEAVRDSLAAEAERQRGYDTATALVEQQEQMVARLREQLVAAEEKLRAYRDDLVFTEQRLEEQRHETAELRAARDQHPHTEIRPLREALAQAQSAEQERALQVQHHNAKLRAWDDRRRRAADVEAQHNSKAASYDHLTHQIEGLRQEKAAKLAATKWPIEGLGIEGEEVTFNGLPFDQASSAEQLRVSLAIGLALNPKVPVLLFYDGSLLDDTSLGIVAEMAEQAGAQVWIERVGKGDRNRGAIIIEDGLVAP